MDDKDIEREIALLKQDVSQIKEDYKVMNKEMSGMRDFSIEQKVMNERLMNNLDSIKSGVSEIKDGMNRIQNDQKKMQESQNFNWVEFVKTKAIPFLIVSGAGAYIISKLVK